MRTCFALIIIFSRAWIIAQIQYPIHTTDSNLISILYTGRSLGSLGVMRSQEEHELLTEQANTEKIPFKLVSHACWRAPGLAIFLPSDEPRGSELTKILNKKDSVRKIENFRALKSQNALLVQDPELHLPDMLEMILQNPRQPVDFPDIQEVLVSVYSMTIRDGDQVYIIEEKDALWPKNLDMWTLGEVNRIDIGNDGRLFELPVNLGQMAVRSYILNDLKSKAGTDQLVLADLGQRTSNFEISPHERARIDFTILNQMDYKILVPYHFELTLGADSLKKINQDFPFIKLLASNIKSKDSSLFYSHLIQSFGNLKLGLIGLVDPSLQGDLAKSSLQAFTFLPPVEAVKTEIKKLKKTGVNAIIVLSNLDASDNALIAEQVAGIDVILADLHTRWSPETIIQTVDLRDRNQSRPGSPALVARSFANGLGLGQLDLAFNNSRQLIKIIHRLIPITDRSPLDTVIYKKIQSLIKKSDKASTDLIFPAFIDLIARNPDLKNYDAITRQGRVSQKLWEEFVARLLRKAGPSELTIMRRFPYFPSLIGKLHEEEVRSWLWTEEEIILCDVKGDAILKILADDINQELIINGLVRPKLEAGLGSIGMPSKSAAWFQFNTRVMGRFIDPEAYYRVATTDVVFEGIRATDFLESRHVRRNFTIDVSGQLVDTSANNPLPLRNFVLGELKRLRSKNKGDKFLEIIADRLKPDPKFERLVTFNFDSPTLWSSYNRKFNSEEYGAVPESRITAVNSWVIGASGRFKATTDGLHSAMDLGLTLAYAKQNSQISKNVQQISESADDIKLDLTYRRKSAGAFQSFIRSQYDTEFTPTVNPTTEGINPKQQALRGVIGITRKPNLHWRNVELASLLEHDFGQNKAQLGFTARADGRFLIKGGNMIYSFRNDATYFLKSKEDTKRDLAFKYIMVHEIYIPLIDDLSLSIAADLFFFKGKVLETKEPGMSMLLRVGITYDRIWKPRYQPLF